MRLEFSEGSSNKFWEAVIAGAVLTTRWGKIGGSINSRVYELASAEAARAQRDKMVREKTGKGYREVGGGTTTKPAAKVSAAPTKARASSPATSSVKSSELVLTELRPAGTGGRLSRIALDGRRVVAGGDRTLASSDGTHFHGRQHLGTMFALTAIDGAFYACGGPFVVSRDLGQTWREITVPANGYRFSILRDSKGTWWLGCDDGLVLTSKQPDKGWKKAPFQAFGRVLAIVEVDGKLLCAGADSGVWDGKRYQRLKGMKRSDIVCRITESPAGTLIAVGDKAIGYRSEDRGKTWKPITIAARKQDLEDCAWVAGALFVVGGAGTLLRSTNDGKSFTKVAVPFVSHQKLWGIASWGDGAFIGGDRGVLLKLASPKDEFWKGAKDELAPPPPSIDANFIPAVAAKRDAEYARLHAEAVKAYTPTRDTRSPDANPDLARLVDADVDGSSDALGVYADWLQGQGDPRGELAAIQLQRLTAPKDKALAKAEKGLLATHAAALLGTFAQLADVAKLEWRGGFIHTARIANTFERDPHGDGDEESRVSIDELLPELLDHPSARFLRELTVGIIEFTDNSYDKVAKAIGKRHLPSLRKLYLGDFDGEETEISWSRLGNLQPIYAALPSLRWLRLQSGSMNLGKIVHPTLEHFEIVTGGLDPKSAKAIATATWPSLRTLTIMIGQERYGGTSTLKDLRPILDGVGLPRLRRLGLTNLEFTDELVEALAQSKILPQLEELDLSLGTLSDDGARRFYRFQKAFQHLKQLDVSDNYVTNDGLKLLRTLKIPVEAGAQRDDEGDPSNRYTSVGE